ncbi:PolC-type DNA polymerase III [Spiroplasma endosymbiont of Crioceris asparagi]|uniref:PolC-type DNA polymerase III n=1 Tax=Spiroplasma endosymbiont of Crioceris asparagi TaxID=3066286 RepID=UPI0030D1440A
MKQEVKYFFEKINLTLSDQEKSLLEDAGFFATPVASKTNKKIRIFLEVNNFFPYDVLDDFETKLANALPDITIKVNFKIRNFQLDKENLFGCVEYIIAKKSRIKNGIFTLISPDSMELIENDLYFLAFNDIQFKEFSKERQYLQERIIKYGFSDIELKIKMQENGSTVKERVAENKKLVEQRTTRPKVDKYQKENFNYKLGKPTYNNLEKLEEGARNVVVHGRLFKKEMKVSKSGRNLYLFSINDETSAIKCVHFPRTNAPTAFDESANFAEEDWIKVGDWIAVKGDYNYSKYDEGYNFMINDFEKIPSKDIFRTDDATEKRTELHIHSKMSIMDGVSSISEYIKTAKKWNWDAIALTDHLNVQAFPEAFHTLRAVNKGAEKPLKLIYGVEVGAVNDDYWFVKNPKGLKIKEQKLVVLDIETTGLSPEFDEIIEFGANIYEPGQQTKKVDILIKPRKPISAFTTELTHITNDQLSDKNPIEKEIAHIYEILKDGILVAHNANFDFNFLNAWVTKLGLPKLENTVLDTLTIARALKPDLKNHRLGTVCKAYGILYDDKIAHRADYDAEVLANLYERIVNFTKKDLQIIYDKDWNKLFELEGTKQNLVRPRPEHVQILAKNQKGLKQLYKIISFSHVDDFMEQPKILYSHLWNMKTKDLLIGAGCQNSPIFEQIRTGTFDNLEATIKKFDYVEIHPLSVYNNLLETGALKLDELKKMIKKIIELCLKNNVLLVGTSDAHYVNPQQKIIREIYIETKGLQGRAHPLFDYKGRIKNYPDQHLRNTDEMLKEFAWLKDEQLIYDIVIKNPNLIAAMVDASVEPVKMGSYPPSINNVEDLLINECYRNAKAMYGDKLPEIVEARLKKELDSIIKHKFSVIYWISHLLVKQSYDDSYLVGSRGSVGSSFVATAAKITEVNPLKAHYRCEKCKYSNFDTNPEIKCGFDLPDENCPNCGALLIGDGHDIPFETFLGFDGDKVPDIDLNFSGDYQAKAHNFTKKMFGEHNVFRAGTISTVAEKTAFGFVKGYFEKHQLPMNKAKIEWLASMAIGVKRTTGQHPGGIIILPKSNEIEDFTPVNYPADDCKSSWLTTHFDFHAIHDNLLKMDILGHDDPTVLKMLYDLTGVDPQFIPTNDPKVYRLFSNIDVLGIKPERVNNETTGSIGLPEFGTTFVRKMLSDTKPKSFSDLVQISGLSHGTDVYVGNAETLIKNKIADISSVIGCRDDIMVYLLDKGLNPSLAFKIMESVRKGKGISDADIVEMKQHNVPEWYIESCLKIKYMFPKAHATAYVLMAYRTAWYKIYYPEEYYAAWYSAKAKFFDMENMLKGEEKIRQVLNDILERKKTWDTSTKEDSLITTYEVMLEMYERGIEIKNIDFSLSDEKNYTVHEINGKKYIIPPFIAIDSLGEAVAKSIVDARNQRSISSVEDLKRRTQVNQTHVALLIKLKVVESLKDDEQISFNF